MVANLFHTVESDLSKGSLPTALRRVMKEKFSSFDEYQLAKYNKSIKVKYEQMKIFEWKTNIYRDQIWRNWFSLRRKRDRQF